LLYPWPQAVNLRQAVEPDEFNMNFRHWHDKYGWKAKGHLGNLGLCSGAIYRTEAFMSIAQADRTGGGDAQTVHIEHTVPVSTLVQKWQNFRDPNVPLAIETVYAWMFVHSVCTAFTDIERALGLAPYDRTTLALNAPPEDQPEVGGPSWFNRPFRRYDAHPANGTVFNVLTGQVINSGEWSFVHHFQSILDLLYEAGAPFEQRRRIVRAAVPILQRFVETA
jgi:hypothetical protein